jgi:hypothetical protein
MLPLHNGQMTRFSSDYCLARRLYAVVALTFVALASGCSPSLNWREVRPQAADGLVALFPCKPDAHARELAWPGMRTGVTMHMLSCQTEEGTWALSYLTLPDAALVPEALQELSLMMRRNLGAASQMAGQGAAVTERDLGAIEVPRMTPMPQAHAWQFLAQRPDGLGRPLEMDIRSWHFSHALTVFQASVWRPAVVVKGQTSEDVADAFFRGLHFPG